MFSSEDECVNLVPTLYPIGGVEEWMVVVESSMKNTLRVVLGESLKTIFKEARQEWVLCWPGQVVIAGCQTYWTAIVENGILGHRLPTNFEVILSNVSRMVSACSGLKSFVVVGCAQGFGERLTDVLATRDTISPDCHRGPC